MRHPAKPSKVRFLCRVAAVALLAGGSAGCSADVTRFGGLFEQTDNRADIVQNSGATPSDGVVTGSLSPTQGYRTPAVSSQPLAPTPGAVASNAPFVRPDPGVTQQAVAVAPVQQAPRAAGWSAAGGSSVTVRPGESVQTLARRYGVPETALLAANNLPKGAALQPGSQVVIPVYSHGGAPQTASAAAPAGQLPAGRPTAAAPAQMAAGAGGVYTVKAGDSLGRIANAYGMRSTELAAANGFDASQPIRIGQKLKIPAAGAAPTKVAALSSGTLNDASGRPQAPVPAHAPASAPKPVAVAPAAPASPTTPAPVQPAPQKQAVTAPQPAQQVKPQMPTGTGVQSAANGNFRWPVRGRVISGYGVKANGERNDGINIEVPEGTPIKAAEGGEVIYAGNELKGYGNLVLVKHPSGFVSAYAHASEILVRRGDTIMRGQTLGKVGTTGNVARPQLHFEIRNGNRPVDPLPHLSG